MAGLQPAGAGVSGGTGGQAGEAVDLPQAAPRRNGTVGAGQPGPVIPGPGGTRCVASESPPRRDALRRVRHRPGGTRSVASAIASFHPSFFAAPTERGPPDGSPASEGRAPSRPRSRAFARRSLRPRRSGALQTDPRPRGTRSVASAIAGFHPSCFAAPTERGPPDGSPAPRERGLRGARGTKGTLPARRVDGRRTGQPPRSSADRLLLDRGCGRSIVLGVFRRSVFIKPRKERAYVHHDHQRHRQGDS